MNTPVAAAVPTEADPQVAGGGIELPGDVVSDLTPAWASLDERSWNLSTG